MAGDRRMKEDKRVGIGDAALCILAAPGTVTKQFFRKVACDIADVDVYSIGYFVWGTTFFPIKHAPVNKAQALTFILVPLIGNSLLCAAISMTVFTSFFFLADFSLPLLQWVDFWVGIALGIAAVPDEEDAEMLFAMPASENVLGLAKAIAFIIKMRRAWIDFLYAALVGLAIPWLAVLVLNTVNK
jgi:hypothetical protein